MFKVYCHTSSQTTVLYYLKPYNPINIKKKDIHFRDPARPRKTGVYFCFAQVFSLFHSSRALHAILFVLPSLVLGLRPIFKLIRSDLLLLGFASHLASILTILFLATLNQLA
jgi:hypothetical protein